MATPFTEFPIRCASSIATCDDVEYESMDDLGSIESAGGIGIRLPVIFLPLPLFETGNDECVAAVGVFIGEDD